MELFHLDSELAIFRRTVPEGRDWERDLKYLVSGPVDVRKVTVLFKVSHPTIL